MEMALILLCLFQIIIPRAIFLRIRALIVNTLSYSTSGGVISAGSSSWFEVATDLEETHRLSYNYVIEHFYCFEMKEIPMNYLRNADPVIKQNISSSFELFHIHSESYCYNFQTWVNLELLTVAFIGKALFSFANPT